jgi:hypothetical protein
MRLGSLLSREPYRRQAHAAGVAMRGAVDGLRLIQRYPFLGPGAYPEHAGRAHAALEPAYRAYVAEVSAPEMAISLEFACLVWVWLDRLEPGSVADLGSGFSSYVVRALRRDSGRALRIVSVDDAEPWRAKTRRFLEAEQLPADELISWEAFVARGDTFDCVLHDLGTLAVRLATLPHALARCASSGTLLLDDAHRPEYARPAAALVRQVGRPLLSARRFTLDALGRFAAIAGVRSGVLAAHVRPATPTLTQPVRVGGVS